MRPHPRVRSHAFFKGCLALVATLVAVGISEVAVRLLEAAPQLKAIELASEDCVYQRSENPVLGFELKPDYRNDQPDFIASYERTNSHGQRDAERSLEKAAGTRRILLLGDSVVEGHGLAEQDTISNQWENLYADGSTEVLNFGVSAYCTLAEIELLETKGLAFDPDVVVVVFVENDFDNFNREAFALGGMAKSRPAVVNWLFGNSHLFRLAAVRFDLFQFGAESDPIRWNTEAIGDNNVVQGFERLKALSDREGFTPLIALWPRFSDDAIADVPPISESDPTPLAEQLATTFGLPSVRLSSAFQKHRVEEGVSNPRLYYSSGDGLHPSPRGAEVAASMLKNLVERQQQGEEMVARRSVSDDARLAAVDAARSLGAAEPDYSRVYHRQGVQFLKDGHYQQAIEQFEKALSEDPEHAGAHGNMGLAYERLGKLAKAKIHYQKAVDIRDSFQQGHYNLARLALAEGDTESALTSLKTTLKIDPDHTDALNLLGMELGKAGKFKEAQTHLSRAIRLDPDFSEAHNNLATTYAATGNLQKALEQFKKALKADPTNEGAKARMEQVQRMLQEQE